MNPHPVEALLRPPVELWSALVAVATGTMAILAPWALMMPPGVAHALAQVHPDILLVGLHRVQCGRAAHRR